MATKKTTTKTETTRSTHKWTSDQMELEAFVNCGRSMLRRFQMGGDTLEAEVVTDRLLLTY